MNTLSISLLGVAAAAVLATSGFTQTESRVLGLTNASPLLVQKRVYRNCQFRVCNLPMPPALIPWAGGTAHDPRDRFTWVSTGTEIMKVDARDGCTVQCPPVPMPGLLPGTVVTGLALNETNDRLFASISDNRIVSLDTTGCVLTPVAQCAFPAPVNHIVSGVATDDAGGAMFIVTSPWLGPSTVQTTVWVSQQGSPCTPFCRFVPDDCAGAVMPRSTGLAYDACADTLFVTDGAAIVGYRAPGSCTPRQVQCCPPDTTLGERFIGLCILPAGEQSVGTPCFMGSTGPCPTMDHVLSGDPTIGNLGFSLDLVNAPANANALLFYALGPCSGPGAFSPPLCGPVMPTTPFWPVVNTGGTIGCTGSASMPFPIPNLRSFCGIVLSTQWVGWVSPLGVNNFTSNCLSWEISSS